MHFGHAPEPLLLLFSVFFFFFVGGFACGQCSVQGQRWEDEDGPGGRGGKKYAVMGFWEVGG